MNMIKVRLTVSIPHGNPQPFSHDRGTPLRASKWMSQSRTGIPSHLAAVTMDDWTPPALSGLNPARESPAI